MATHAPAELRAGGPARRRRRARARPRPRPASSAAVRRLRRLCTESSSPARAPRSARPSSRPRSPAPWPPRGRPGRGLQARRDRPRRRRASPTTAAAPGRRARTRATTRSPPTATGRRSPRTSRRSWPARRSTRRGCCAPPARRRRAPTRSSARGSAACSCRWPPDYLVRDLARRPRPAPGRRRLARPRHDQPHAADARGGARRRARGGIVVLTPWPDAPPRSSAQTGRRSPRSARSGWRRCRARPRATRGLAGAQRRRARSSGRRQLAAADSRAASATSSADLGGPWPRIAERADQRADQRRPGGDAHRGGEARRRRLAAGVAPRRSSAPTSPGRSPR